MGQVQPRCNFAFQILRFTRVFQKQKLVVVGNFAPRLNIGAQINEGRQGKVIVSHRENPKPDAIYP